MSRPWEAYPLRRVLDVPVRAMTMDQTVEVVERVIRQSGRLLIGVVNAAKIVNMRRDGALREAVLKSDVILADGIAVVWAGKVLREPVPERVAGIDLMIKMLESADRNGYRVYFLGAREEVSLKVVELARERYPGLVVAGRRDGYYEDEEAIVADIRAAKPDMLFVAMSPPKKEIFLARWFESLETKVCHGVGGAFDVVAGRVKRAPRLWRRLGLEWLYRVVQEPRRLWRRYWETNTRFLWMLIREAPRRKRTAPDRERRQTSASNSNKEPASTEGRGP